MTDQHINDVVGAIERGDVEVLVNTDEVRGRFRVAAYPHCELSGISLSTETVYDIDFAVFAHRPPRTECLWHVDARECIRADDLDTVIGIMLRWGAEKIERLNRGEER